MSSPSSTDPPAAGAPAPRRNTPRSSPGRISAPRVAEVSELAAELAPEPAVPVDLLEAAAQDVLRTWADRLRESVDESEVACAVSWIRGAVEAVGRHEEPKSLEGQVTLTRFLLERFASSLLSLLGTDPHTDKADTLALLRGVDRVRQLLEPEWDRYFATQFLGPDGLSLVTELAHDIRSPLTSIRLLAEVLERGQSGPVTDVQRTQLRLIYSAALGLGSMAADIIEMARRGDQLVDAETVPFSVAELVDGVVDLVRPLAEEKGLTLTVQRIGTNQRMGAPLALSRVLLNLVTNAFKFTDQGGVEIQVRATSPTAVEFAVADTGRGMREEVLADLYKPFRRSPSRVDRSGFLFSNTGLGLALCRKLVRSMGSELQLQTAVGEGTRFYFELELPPTTRL